jgi:hypothetical protein
MHMLHSLFYLTTALYVSGVTITHLQEHKTTLTIAPGNCYAVLLSAAIVEDLELFQLLSAAIVEELELFQLMSVVIVGEFEQF